MEATGAVLRHSRPVRHHVYHERQPAHRGIYEHIHHSRKHRFKQLHKHRGRLSRPRERARLPPAVRLCHSRSRSRGDSRRHKAHSPRGNRACAVHGGSLLHNGAIHHNHQYIGSARRVQEHIHRGIQPQSRHRCPRRHSHHRRAPSRAGQRRRHRHGIDNARSFPQRIARARGPYRHARSEHRLRPCVHAHSLPYFCAAIST